MGISRRRKCLVATRFEGHLPCCKICGASVLMTASGHTIWYQQQGQEGSRSAGKYFAVYFGLQGIQSNHGVLGPQGLTNYTKTLACRSPG